MPVVVSNGTESRTTNSAMPYNSQREDITPDAVLNLEQQKALTELAAKLDPAELKKERITQGQSLELNQLIENNLQLLNQSNISNQTREILKSVLTNNPDSAKVINNTFFSELKNGLNTAQQLELNKQINRLLTEDLSVEAVGQSQEAIRNSILESIANGPLGFKQGRHATCTVSSEFTFAFISNPSNAVRNLVELAVDGQTKLKGGTTMNATSSALVLEADSATHYGATLAETLWRDSAMQHALKLSETDRLTFHYDTQKGETLTYWDGQHVTTFTGLHPEHWNKFHEQMAGCHISHHSTTVDGGRYAAHSGIEYLQESGKPMRVEIAYAEDGPHNRHYVTALGVFTDNQGVERVRFSNNQSEIVDRHFKSVADTHRLEGDGTQSMSVADFEKRMLSFAMEQQGLKPGVVQNNYGSRSFISYVENAINTGADPYEVIEFQHSGDFSERAKKLFADNETSVKDKTGENDSTNVIELHTTNPENSTRKNNDDGGVAQTSRELPKKKIEDEYSL